MASGDATIPYLPQPPARPLHQAHLFLHRNEEGGVPLSESCLPL